MPAPEATAERQIMRQALIQEALEDSRTLQVRHPEVETIASVIRQLEYLRALEAGEDVDPSRLDDIVLGVQAAREIEPLDPSLAEKLHAIGVDIAQAAARDRQPRAFHYLMPEVPGELGANTELDRSVHPPRVQRLHYDLDGWLGDAILESFPVFIVTEQTRDAIRASGATGASFDHVDVTVTAQFRELYPDRLVPSFAWLKPTGTAGCDDFGVAGDGRLVVSDCALETLRGFGIDHAEVAPFV